MLFRSLKMSYKSFTQVVILGSARYTPFMQLSAGDRRSVIEDLLDIQIFSNMNSIVKDKLSVLKESIQDCKYNIDLYKDKIELQKHNINQNKRVNEDLILTKKEIIANTISDIEEHCSIIAEFSKQNDELLESIADLNSINTKKSKLETIEFKLNGNITKLEKENQFFNLNDDCPTCRQNIDKDRKSTRLNSSHTDISRMPSSA